MTIPKPASSRSIVLDDVYIKQKSKYYRKLSDKKIEAYQIVNSRLIDRKVIFARWINGNEILYIKEFSNVNIIYIYNRRNQRYREVFRVSGTLTVSRTSLNGRYLYLKRLTIASIGLPIGDTFVYDTLRKIKRKIPGSYPFLNFSISPKGNSIFIEKPNGINEYFINTRKYKLLLPGSRYRSLFKSDAPTIAFYSPNRKNILLIHGSGGSYRSRIITRKSSWNFSGISSAAEIFWISNKDFVYRTGGPGNFSVYIYDIKTRRRKRLINNSMHTSIQFSRHPKIITFLKDQVIYLYDVRKKNYFNTGLEGDEISFSPNGTRFTSILYQKLLLTHVHTVKKNRIRLKRIHGDIATIYNNLKGQNKYWTNNYSKNYINKRFFEYSRMSKSIR